MSLKALLVHVDDSTSCAARFDVALHLALIHDAHLTALYVDRLYAREWNALTVENARSYENGVGGDVLHGLLQERSYKMGVDVEWRKIKMKDELEMALHARYADLTIVGQPDPAAHLYTSLDFPAALTLAVARPILMIPHDYKFAPVGLNILLAWNGSREATRAAADSLAMLKLAQKVTVLVIGQTQDPVTERESGADIALYLARHGVKVDVLYVQAAGDDGDVADMILSRAASANADMIVMGVYGHWRVREFLVGGVTRSMVRQSVLPVLMSH